MDPLIIPCLFGWGAEVNELFYGEHVVLILQTVSDDMCAQGDHLQSFEFVANFPTNVINAKLQSLRCI